MIEKASNRQRERSAVHCAAAVLAVQPEIRARPATCDPGCCVVGRPAAAKLTRQCSDIRLQRTPCFFPTVKSTPFVKPKGKLEGAHSSHRSLDFPIRRT